MEFSDDPIMDAYRHDAEQEEALKMLPVCACCGEPIQQDKAIYYNDQWCCKDCEFDFWQDIRDDFLTSTDSE